MADSIAGIGFVDERRDIDADFAHLYEIMESRSFRTNSGLAGEQPYYIYDYSPMQELEVAEHIKQLANRLQTMTPKDDGDYAPQVLTLDLYDIALEILEKRGILDRIFKREEKRHKKVSSDVHTDNFLRLLDNILGADANHLPDTIRDHYEQAKSEAEQAKQASESAKADLKAKQDAYAQAKAKSDEAERQVKDLEAALADLRAKTDALTAAQSDLDTKIQAYRQAATARDEATKQVEQAKTNVKNAEQALTDAKAKLEQARKEAKDTDAVKVAQSVVDKAQTDLDAAKQALAAAQAKLADAKTTQAKAKSDYDKAQAALAAAIKNAADRNGSKANGASGPQIEQAGLKSSEKATSNAAVKADQVMASTGANTNGMFLAAVALTGIGWTMLDMKRRRMDVTARHGRR